MKYGLKIVPLDRATGEPLLPTGDVNVPIAITVDGDAFGLSMASVLGKQNVTDIAALAGSLADLLGADIYYRAVYETDAPNKNGWLRERPALPVLALFDERRHVRKHAERIADVLETVDNRCMAADGPVTPTKDEINPDELRTLYTAACAIVKATTNRNDKRARK